MKKMHLIIFVVLILYDIQLMWSMNGNKISEQMLEAEIKTFLKNIDPHAFKDMSFWELVTIYNYTRKEGIPLRLLKGLSQIKDAAKLHLPQKFNDELLYFKKDGEELFIKPWFGSSLIREDAHYNRVKTLHEKGVALKNSSQQINSYEGASYLSENYELNYFTDVLKKYLNDKKQGYLEGQVRAQLLRYKTALEKNLLNQLGLEETEKWLDIIKNIHKEYATLPQGQIPEQFKEDYLALFTTLNTLKNKKRQKQLKEELLSLKRHFHEAIRNKNVYDAQEILEKFRKIDDHRGKEAFIEWAHQKIEFMKTATEAASKISLEETIEEGEIVRIIPRDANIYDIPARQLVPSIPAVFLAPIMPQRTAESLMSEELECLTNLQPNAVNAVLLLPLPKSNDYVHKNLDEVKEMLRRLNHAVLFDPLINTQKTVNEIKSALLHYVNLIELMGITDTSKDVIIQTGLDDLKTLTLREVQVIEERIKESMNMRKY